MGGEACDWSRDALVTVADGLGLRRLEGYGTVQLLAPEAALRTSVTPETIAISPEPRTPPAPTRTATEEPSRREAAPAAVPEEAPAPLEPDSLGIFLLSLNPENRARSINGLLTTARKAAQYRAGLNAERVLELLAQQAQDLPWCRALGPDARAAVERIIRSTEVTTFVTRLEQERRA